MTRDERIEAMRKLAARHPDPTTWLTGDITFLLAELDAAQQKLETSDAIEHDRSLALFDWAQRALVAEEQNAMLTARVQRLTDALERMPCDIYAHADCRAQSPAIIEKVGLCPRCAALAEGEDIP